MKTSILLVTLLALNSLAHAGEAKSADAQAVDSACAAEAKAAGCGDEKIGTGLMKCFAKYHKSNPSYKPSDACHAAIVKWGQDRKAAKTSTH